MTTKLDEIAKKANGNKQLRFTSLAHLITPNFLKETWRKMNRWGASGVDGKSIEEYEDNLDERLEDLVNRLKAGRYKAPPVRRVEIPKSDGKIRTLGIPTVEDRLLQAAVARILGVIFETNFLDCSYGYRPRRGAHDALRSVRNHVIGDKVMHIFEADIRSYFDKVNHEWLRRMLSQRIADPKIIRLINKWLRAGAMQHGLRLKTQEGVPQGGPVSPILANIYLHYVLDLWFEKKIKPTNRGVSHLVRYADDFIICFQYESDAKNFGKVLPQRLQEFSLEISSEKTRRIVFGRFAQERCSEEGQKPETFEFLGFQHVCGTDRAGKYALIRLPSQKSCRRFLERTKIWLREHMHWKVRDQQKYLSAMLQGLYQYYALPHCCPKLSGIHMAVMRQWRRTLQRRSQRNKTHWGYLKTCEWFKLPIPMSLHSTV